MGSALAAGLTLALTASAAAQSPGTPPVPISSAPTTAPAFVGKVAKPNPIARGFAIPRDPFLAPNNRSNLHVDAYQSDAYNLAGPRGRNLGITSTLFTKLCGSLTFDSQGRILTICIGFAGPVLVMMDPTTLQTLATFPLPGPQGSSGDPFLHISGGGYFYLDNKDRVVVPTNTRHIFVISEGGPSGFTQVADYDLTGVVPAGVGVLSDMPDWKGHIWFAAENGTVGWVDRRNGSIHPRNLNEQIANSLATDPTGGVYIVTTRALYRLQASHGKAKVIWRAKYPNSGVSKPGQLSAGSGTTPTLVGKNEVAITDNANRMHAIVYTRGRTGGGKEICRRGVFQAGAADDENSLVSFGKALIAENNYGYTEQSMEAGALTSPGVTRIDVKKGRCRTIWTSQERVPSVVSKASLKSGLLYTYTRPPTSDGSQAWYFTALDLRTGKTVYSRLTGAGTLFNNHYAPVTIGRAGVAYVGVLGGLLRIADTG
jgi:hypothetical protein